MVSLEGSGLNPNTVKRIETAIEFFRTLVSDRNQKKSSCSLLLYFRWEKGDVKHWGWKSNGRRPEIGNLGKKGLKVSLDDGLNEAVASSLLFYERRAWGWINIALRIVDGEVKECWTSSDEQIGAGIAAPPAEHPEFGHPD